MSGLNQKQLEFILEKAKNSLLYAPHEIVATIGKKNYEELKQIEDKDILQYLSATNQLRLQPKGASTVTKEELLINETIIMDTMDIFSALGCTDYAIVSEEEVEEDMHAKIEGESRKKDIRDFMERCKTERKNKRYLVLIDPLDGTRDLLNGGDNYTILWSLVDNEIKEPILGIIVKPESRDIFSAIKGCGSFVECAPPYKYSSGRRPLQTSQQADFSKSKILRSGTHKNLETTKILDRIEDKYGYGTITQMGSAANKMANIANGHFDWYIHYGKERPIFEYDTAAGFLIAKEAGGEVTDIIGNPIKYNKDNLAHEGGIIASNGKMHKQITDNVTAIMKDLSLEGVLEDMAITRFLNTMIEEKKKSSSQE